MKNHSPKTTILIIVALAAAVFLLTGCDIETAASFSSDIERTMHIAGTLEERQPTPTDIDYSLERFNLIRRAYWVNGQRDKALTYPCPIADRPLGYVVLLTESGAVVGRFEVDGKVSSLNSYLAPDSEYHELVCGDEYTYATNDWVADVDGSYGENDSGIFFFTPDGRYVEWNGIYLYSDIPFIVADPVVFYEVNANE